MGRCAGIGSATGESEIDPPTEEEKGDGDQGNGHGVLHKGSEMITAPGGADFVQTKTDVNQKHEYDSHPIIELGENRNCCVYVSAHRVPLFPMPVP